MAMTNSERWIWALQCNLSYIGRVLAKIVTHESFYLPRIKEMIAKFQGMYPEERNHIIIYYLISIGLSSTGNLGPYLMSNEKRCSRKEVIHTLRSCQLHALAGVVRSSAAPIWRSNGTGWTHCGHDCRIMMGFAHTPSQSLDQFFVIPDLILQFPHASRMAWRLVLVLHQIRNPFRIVLFGLAGGMQNCWYKSWPKSWPINNTQSKSLRISSNKSKCLACFPGNCEHIQAGNRFGKSYSRPGFWAGFLAGIIPATHQFSRDQFWDLGHVWIIWRKNTHVVGIRSFARPRSQVLQLNFKACCRPFTEPPRDVVQKRWKTMLGLRTPPKQVSGRVDYKTYPRKIMENWNNLRD